MKMRIWKWSEDYENKNESEYHDETMSQDEKNETKNLNDLLDEMIDKSK